MNSYPSIYGLGHRAIKDLFSRPVQIEEKVDGSQISFGLSDTNPPVLSVRSKGALINPDAPDKMFSLGVQSIISKAESLVPGYTYRGEYLRKPQHNALTYNRVPTGHIIIFDIMTGLEDYMSYRDKANEAARLGFECVPLLYQGPLRPETAVEFFNKLLELESCLGGPKIEGVVIKQLDVQLYSPDKKPLIGKYVSEAFKEVHRKEWGKANPKGTDIVTAIADRYRTEARWHKAIQHMREGGKLTESPKDIGPLLKEIIVDIQKECTDEIAQALFRWAWPTISRRCIAGFPEFYKEKLLEQQPSGDASTSAVPELLSGENEIESRPESFSESCIGEGLDFVGLSL